MNELDFDNVQFIELDLKEVLGPQEADPPTRRFWDFMPHRLVRWLRTKFRWPRISPYEKWLAALMIKLTVIYSDNEKMIKKNKDYFAHTSTVPVVKKDDKDWN